MQDVLARDATGLSGRIADFASSFRLEAAPAIAIANAKCAILDCLGVGIFAATQEIGAVMLRFARDNAAPGASTIWGTGLAASPRDAALVNATLAHGLDFDDRGHSSTYTLAAPLALGEARDASGKALLEAFIIGREVRNALDPLFSSREAGIGPGAKGWHSNGILGPIAAACAAGRMIGLDRDQILAAIGLAAGSGGALTRDGGTMAKPYRCGQSATTGVAVALLAAAGASSDATALEGRWGLFEALGPIPDDITASLGADLGKRFHLEKPVRGKLYSSCSASQGALEAMLRLVARTPLDPARIQRITLDLKPYPLVRDMPRRGYEGRFSMRFCLAMALLHNRLEPGDFSDAMVADPAVQRIMGRIEPAPGSSELIVTLEDGTRLAEPVARHPTSIARWEEFADKFRRYAAPLLKLQGGEGVIAGIAELETLPSVRELARALKPGS